MQIYLIVNCINKNWLSQRNAFDSFSKKLSKLQIWNKESQSKIACLHLKDQGWAESLLIWLGPDNQSQWKEHPFLNLLASLKIVHRNEVRRSYLSLTVKIILKWFSSTIKHLHLNSKQSSMNWKAKLLCECWVTLEPPMHQMRFWVKQSNQICSEDNKLKQNHVKFPESDQMMFNLISNL